MSGVFSRPKQPKIEAEPAELEPVEEITEDTSEVRRRERKKLLKGGRPSTIISGIKSQLVKRMGDNRFTGILKRKLGE